MTKPLFSVFPSTIPTNLNVFRNTELQAVIQIPEPVQSFSITPCCSSDPGEWILIVGSKTGQIYRTSGKEYNARSKHHYQEYQASLENQQIFTDLLDPVASDCEAGNSKGPGITSPESFVLVLSSAEIILSLGSSVLDVCQTLDFIFTVIKDDTLIKVLCFPSDVYNTWAKPLTVHVLERKACFHRTCDRFHLYILTCDLIKYPGQARSCSTIEISNDIFKSIGSVDVSLCNSPILLLTAGDGSVYYSALNPWPSSPEPLNFSLLYPTSKPVVNIQSCNLNLQEKNRPDADSPFNQKTVSCLALCSSNGDSVILTCDEKHGAQLIPFTVPSSLAHFEIVGQKMYFSSEEDLFVCDVVLLEKDNKFDLALHNMSSLRFACAVYIKCVLDITSTEEAVSHILCRTVSGKVVTIDVNVRTNQSPLNKTQKQGQQIRELLTAIENCHLHAEKLMVRETRQREFISQLNIASHLINSKGLLHCRYKILQNVKGEDYFLSCQVTNQSDIKLSCDWSLVVDVHQSFPHKSSSGSESLDWGVDPKESVHIQIGLPSQDTKIPYDVTVTLCLHFPADLQGRPSQSDKVLSVVVDQRTIDILYFLFDEKCLHQKTTQTRFDLNTVITELALRRPVAHSASVGLQSAGQETVLQMNLFVATPLLKEPEISAYGQDTDAVLRFLTQSSQHPVDIVNHEVKLVDPTGEPVKLAIEMSDCGKDTANLKLNIASRGITLLAAVRESVIKQLQSIQKTGDEWESVMENFPKDSLTSVDLSTMLSSTATKEDVIQVYRHLRCGRVDKMN